MKEEERKAGLTSEANRPFSPQPKETPKLRKESNKQPNQPINFGTVGKSQHSQTHSDVFFNTLTRLLRLHKLILCSIFVEMQKLFQTFLSTVGSSGANALSDTHADENQASFALYFCLANFVCLPFRSTS